MTVTNKRIDPIEPSSTPGGFIRAARLLPDSVGDWSGGVTFLQNCGGSSTWSCDFAGATKDIPQTGDAAEFDPFIVYAGERCLGKPSDELRQLVANKLTRGASSSLAVETHTSAHGRPDLQGSAVDITPVGGPPCVNNAMAGLLSAICDNGGGDVVFHVPLVGLASLMTYDLVEFSDGRYRMGGHTVIVDCYPNEGPGGAAAAADEVWIYATGPVEYALGQVQEIRNFDNETNEDVLLLEQLAITRFDPCNVQTILASIC